MTKEAVVDTEIVESEGTTEEVVLSPSEELASSKGWVPFEQWKESGKDPKLWKSAELFNTHGELMARIETMSSAIDGYKQTQAQMEKATEKMAKHMAKQLTAEYERGKRALLEQKKQALRDEDHDAVIEIDEKLRENREAAAQVKEEAEEKATDTVADAGFNQRDMDAVNAWLKDPSNAWYKSDDIAEAYADKAFNKLINQGVPVKDALVQATAKVKDRFPQLFETPKKKGKTIDTDGESRGEAGKGSSKGKHTMKNVDHATRTIVKEMVAAGATSKKGAAGEQEYLDILAESGYFSE